MGIVWKLKKIRIILIAFLIAAITACGVKQGSSEGSSGAAASRETGTTGLSPDSFAPKASQKPAEQETKGEKSSVGKALTLMLYLCGSDLESKAGAASSDLEEILASGVDPGAVNVVVMAGGTTKWQNGFSEGETAVYTLENGADGGAGWKKVQAFSSPEQEEAPADMGESETLQKFLDFSHMQYPAQKYALIMWDHGGGPMRGLCWDTAWAKDNLTMEEFTGALAASPFAGEKLSWIGLDACLMSSVETAHLVSPYADYMIASEETEPSLGWSYDFLKEIEKDEDGAATGRRIVDSFFAAAEAEDVESALTLSCTDLSKVQAVEQGLDGFFDVLSDSLDAETFSELSNLRQDTREFGKAMNDSQRMDLVDLGDLVLHYAEMAPVEAEKLKTALEEMVVYNRSSLENCNGLSAYHPYYNKTYFEKVWQKEYESFQFAPSYTGYINDFAKIWMDDAMGDWTQMSRVQSAGTEQQVQYFSVQLTPEQLQYYASSQLLILSSIGNDDDANGVSYSQVYTTGDVTVDGNGLLTAGYSGRSLYALDDNGEAITGPLRYEITDDGNLQIFANYINEEGGNSRHVIHAMFECAENPDGGDLQILDQYIFDEDMDTWSNRLHIAQEDYQRMILLNDYKKITYSNGRILPFSQWEDGNWAGGYEVSLPESIHFRFFNRNLEGVDLFACFQILDTQANMYGTELMPVENSDVTTVLFEEGRPEDRTPGLDPGLQTITGTQGSSQGDSSQGQTGNETGAEGGSVYTLENDRLRMNIQAKINHSENAKYLEIIAHYENLSGGELSLDIPNGFELSDGSRRCMCFPTEGSLGLYNLEPGSTRTCKVRFSAASLGLLSDVQQIRIVMNGTAEMKETAGVDSGETAATAQEVQSGSGETADTAREVQSGSGETAATAREVQSGSGETAATAQEKQEIEIEAVLHPTNLDLTIISGMAKAEEEDCVLAEDTRGNLHWELLALGQDRYGDVYQEYLIRNDGKEAVTMHLPARIAVNGVVLDSDQYLSREEVTIEAGIECCLTLSASNRQYEYAFFNSIEGSEHLAVSDALNSAGVKDIRTISLLPMDNVYVWSALETDPQELPLRFDLKKSFPLLQKTMTSVPADTEGVAEEGEDKSAEFFAGPEEADAENENTSDGGAGLTPEAMTRALDVGGNAPSRIMLFSEDGVTVYGEHLLIADRTILMTLIVENESEENTILRFYNWETDNGRADNILTDTGYVSFAGTQKRIYLNPAFSAGEDSEENSDLLSEASVSIWKDGDAQGLPTVYRLTLSFADGTAFNQDGGISLSFDEAGAEMSCLTENKEAGNIFDPSVFFPEDSAQYKRTITFALPDALTEEQCSHVTNVLLGVQRDCSDLITPEAQDQVETCLQSLSWIRMEQSTDEKDTYYTDYSGLACVLKDDHTITFLTTENSESDEGTTFRMLGDGYSSSWRINPDPRLYEEWPGYSYTFRIGRDTETGQGILSDFTISDENKTISVSNWPASWFQSLDFELAAPVYTRREDGALDYQPMGYMPVTKNVPLEGKPVSLEMIPVTEYSPDIVLLYKIFFDDGSSIYVEGGKY